MNNINGKAFWTALVQEAAELGMEPRDFQFPQDLTNLTRLVESVRFFQSEKAIEDETIRGELSYAHDKIMVRNATIAKMNALMSGK